MAAESRARVAEPDRVRASMPVAPAEIMERSPTGPWLGRAVGVRPTLMPEAHQALRRTRVGEAVERGRCPLPNDGRRSSSPLEARCPVPQSREEYEVGR